MILPGDLIVDHECPPESQHGIMLVMTERLIFENLQCFATPCQVGRLHTNGLQVQLAHDRIPPHDPRRFALYRLSLWDRFTSRECEDLESVIREMLRSNPPLRSISSVTAIGRILMRFGKLARFNVRLLESYTVSMLVSELVETGIYEHVTRPRLVEALSLPAAAAA